MIFSKADFFASKTINLDRTAKNQDLSRRRGLKDAHIFIITDENSKILKTEVMHGKKA